MKGTLSMMFEVAPPKRSHRINLTDSQVSDPHTRKSLVKGERFIRYVRRS